MNLSISVTYELYALPYVCPVHFPQFHVHIIREIQDPI